MDHLGVDYYAALLTAAQYHGAAHQKPVVFQIITNKQLKKELEFGQVRIDCLYKKSLKDLPTQNITVSTGYLKVSSPELTALDLLMYSNKSGGLNHIATILSELVESIDSEKLIALAKQLGKDVWLQRLGYISMALR
jgi:predicted transcriptional regulator of viral defense system